MLTVQLLSGRPTAAKSTSSLSTSPYDGSDMSKLTGDSLIAVITQHTELFKFILVKMSPNDNNNGILSFTSKAQTHYLTILHTMAVINFKPMKKIQETCITVDIVISSIMSQAISGTSYITYLFIYTVAGLQPINVKT